MRLNLKVDLQASDWDWETICFGDREEVLGSTDILEQKQKQSHCDVGEPCVIGAELMQNTNTNAKEQRGTLRSRRCIFTSHSSHSGYLLSLFY